VIVVIGNPRIDPSQKPAEPDRLAGPAAAIAISSGAKGAAVELVGKIRDDGSGDDVVLALGRAGVGHAAILRDPDATTLDAGDIELALRYLTDFRVIVTAEPIDPDAARVVADAASYAGAHLIWAVGKRSAPPRSSDALTVLDAPKEDGGAFATLVGSYAAALDAGVPAEQAFREAVRDSGWESPSGD
jgi:hypothetical protein